MGEPVSIAVKITVRRGLHIHIVYLDGLSTRLVADWLRERRTC
ncbi:hypothetical protein OG302_41250 [Streptomyces sp. NBC_01283]|nr:hypothetical protein OG302_41250 [Streptomyces sp. NBC_01283]